MAPVDESKKVEKRGAHLKKADADKVAKKEYVPTGKPRGRPKGSGKKPYTGKPRGRPKATKE